ncbi:MAG: hypothetical protein AAFR96_04265 [Planctomycetota bacterium]
MVAIEKGQCGTCAHFGADDANSERLVQIRVMQEAQPDLVEPCGLPENAERSLRVSPVSTCEGYTPANVA